MTNATTTTSQSATQTFAEGRDLVLTRIIDAPPEKVFRAWTDPELMKQWFAPKPYTTPVIEMELRAGGKSLIVMRTPDGNDMPNPGLVLEVVPNKKLVFTDAFTQAWEPSSKPFMTAILTFEDAGSGRTQYTARVKHWTMEDREMHEQMGFHQGWTICAEQLAEVVATIR